MDPPPKATLTTTCHCKAMRITFPVPEAPLNECLCSICRRYAALWTYYKPDEVQIEGTSSDAYAWRNKLIEFHRCVHCGCIMYWTPVERHRQRRGINCRMLEREELAKLEVKQSEGPE